jgi:hypothetical protein
VAGGGCGGEDACLSGLIDAAALGGEKCAADVLGGETTGGEAIDGTCGLAAIRGEGCFVGE